MSIFSPSRSPLGAVVLAAIVLQVTSPAARATTFELRNLGTNLSSPLHLSVDGLGVTLSGGGPIYNSLPTTFGIDSDFSTPDDPNLIDLTETLFFVFDQQVILDAVVISQFDDQDTGELLLKQDSPILIPLQNGLIDVGHVLRAGGGSDRISAAMGPAGGTRGFSVDQIIVHAVPEPSSQALGMLGVVALIARAGRRRRSTL